MDKFKFSEKLLSNNLRVLYIPNNNVSYVSLSLLGKVGRRAEKDNEIGAAHFLEHLIFDGTKKRPTSFQINSFIESYGGQRQGTTSTETVEYFVKVLAENAEVGFEYLSDIFFDSLLKNIEKQRKVIAQEAATKRDDPGAVLTRVRLGTLYPNQSIGRTIFDEEINLKNIERKILLDYMKRTYVAENFLLCIIGNIDEDKALFEAEKYFKKFSKGKKVIFDDPKFQEDAIVNIQNKDFTQSKLSISFRGFPRHTKEALITNVLAIIFGQGSASRLNQLLRQQLHLVYSIRSEHEQYSDTGFFTITTMMNEANLQKVVEEIFKEIKKLIKGVSKKELEMAKNKYQAAFLFELDKPESLAGFVGMQLLLDREIKTPEQRLEDLKEITTDDIQKIAEHIFSDKSKINILTKKLTSINIS